MSRRLLALVLLGALAAPLAVPAHAAQSTLEKEERWRTWADLLGVSPFDLPQAVAQRRGVTLQAPLCDGPAPSLAVAVQRLGDAVGQPDALAPGVLLSSTDEAVLARLVDCIAVHAASLPAHDETQGTAPLAKQSAWLSALRDILGVLPATTLTTAASCVDALCLVQTGGPGNDVYTQDAVLILDSGGSDTYTNNAGGGSTSTLAPIAVLVDQGAGVDAYLPAQTDLYGRPTLGSGYNGGVGILVDQGGGDHYRGLGGTMGAAFSGAGFLLDQGGDDHYESPYPTNPGSEPGQSHKVVGGAGAWGGYGFLIDEAGDDDYVQHGVDSLGWGGAGGFGLLRDATGSDTYTVNPAPTGDVTGGGVTTESGVSIGTGEVGGVGLVLDGAGHDQYACTGTLGYGCIGGSYFGGQLGLVYDAAGNDRYSLAAQSSDNMLVPGGMGAGGLDGLGALVDEGGADTYNSAAGQSGGYGGGGGEGLLLDKGGSLGDTYTFARPPWIGVRANNQQWIGQADWGALSAAGVGIDR